MEFVAEFGEFVAAGHLSGEFVEGDFAAFLVEDGLAEFEDDEVVADEVDKVLVECGMAEVPWRVELAAGANDDIPGTVLAFANAVGAEILVIGARRRSPVGKFLLGSVTQTIILDADMPVVVVKNDR